VENLPLPIATNRGLGELASFARNIFSSSPHTVSKYCRPQVKVRMRELLASQKFDVIICDFVVAAAAIPWEVACPKVIFTHNVEALIWKRHFEVSRNPLWKMASWGEYQKMVRFEKYFLNKAEHVLTVSEADKNFFSDFVDRSKMTVISTGVDTDYFRPDNGNEQPNSLVFTGSMDWMPNEDGVLYFLHSILPLIRREIPQVSFTIVGRKPSERLRSAAASQPGVQVTGTVDDIRPYVRESSVYVVPLRIGSGTRLKIFEAMAMRKAIVSTALGAEGLPIQDGVDISIADSPEEFSLKVCGLLRNAEERRRLGSAARQMVEQHYSWSAVAAEFNDVLRRVAPLSSAREMKLPAAEKLSALRA
jgi:glycosyltransferase involved in cell wall biosynthesis